MNYYTAQSQHCQRSSWAIVLVIRMGKDGQTPGRRVGQWRIAHNTLTVSTHLYSYAMMLCDSLEGTTISVRIYGYIKFMTKSHP